MKKTGIERLLTEKNLRAALHGKRIALVAHPASVDQQLMHSLDRLLQIADWRVSSAFSPQHGMRGEKQDNMVESDSYIDPHYGLPVFSLYGEVRRPTQAMMDTFDVLLFDLQDIGCRIYTYVTTLLYMMQACAECGKAIWILDRPNPAGRPLDGLLLKDNFFSFVGAAPMLLRHGMTMGEMASWYKRHFHLDVDLQVIPMEGYDPTAGPGYGWPLGERSWVNPSPNAANLSMARCFAGTVMLEGTHLSEGRGTTRPLEVVGHPQIAFDQVHRKMRELCQNWLVGCTLREIYFEPTFHKHAGLLCHGLQIHVDDRFYGHEQFRPFLLMSLVFKAIRACYPDFVLWRDFHYEYERDRLAIDLITGSDILRKWVDDPSAEPQDLECLVESDVAIWREELREVALYPL